jgi:hypothetical protein
MNNTPNNLPSSALPLVETPLKTRVQASSADAHKLMAGKRDITRKRLLDVVIQAHRDGRRDLTAREIGELYLAACGDYLPPNEVSARIAELLKAGRLVRGDRRRPCSVTQINVLTVLVPARQGELL